MIETTNDWYIIANSGVIDSPALVVYPQRIRQNIRLLKDRVKDVASLRPHVKTNKMSEVCQAMLDEGITKFKCATIAEAEMLARINAPDVLLAYQPVGPRVGRFIRLVKAYPLTTFSCLVDNAYSAAQLSVEAAAHNAIANIFIDLNVGMNRTGIRPEKAFDLVASCRQLPNLVVAGLHAYDGHVIDTDIIVRQYKSDDAFSAVAALSTRISDAFGVQPVIVAGGSPSFATHLARQQVQFSPGTFVFWDWGYRQRLPDEPYQFAALVISRIISVVDPHTVCTDLGHKAVAAENPLPRVHFLNAPGATPIGQSEEHLVLQVPNSAIYTPGDLLYGVPVHICPTVALYDKAVVVQDGEAVGEWQVVARNRSISI